jgi:hypothetical protein
VRNFCHNARSARASSSRVYGTLGRHSPYPNCNAATSGAGGVARDVATSASCAGHCDITQPSDRTTSISGAGPEAGPTALLD